jgi:biopolymer transport protein ExbB/TolQ
VLPKLTRRLQYLPALSIAAVLLGVLGLLTGVARALLAAAPLAPDTRVTRLMTGIAIAFGPPAAGLGVAAVLTLARSYLASQADFIIEQIHEFSARLINALIDRPDVRLGHR